MLYGAANRTLGAGRIGNLIGMMFVAGGMLVLSLHGAITAPAAAGNGVAPAFDPGEQALAFEANKGQASPAVRFQTHAGGSTVLFAPDVVVLELSGLDAPGSPAAPDAGSRPARQNGAEPALPPPQQVRLQFLAADPARTLISGSALAGRVNYIRGSDPRHWYTDVPTYAGVTYHNLYPGIDLKYNGTGQQLKGTYLVTPGADAGRIRWRYQGAQSVQLDPAGALLIHLADPEGCDQGRVIQERAPVAWQEQDGQRITVPTAYELLPDGSISFKLGDYDPSRPLTIDPVFEGLTGHSAGYSIARDNDGNLYIAGATSETNFPVENAIQPNIGAPGAYDAFIIKIGYSQRIYTTYLGGSGSDQAYGIGWDAAGNAYVVGTTTSPDFPLANPLQPAYGGGAHDAFLAVLNPTGSALVYSTYLGGSGDDQGEAIAVAGTGTAYVTGVTASADFPAAKPLQAANAGGQDAFVTAVNAGGSALAFSTYLGGSGDDQGNGIAIDAAGKIHLAGTTASVDFPLALPLQPGFGGLSDAFVAQLNSTGAPLEYSTYLGGSGADAGHGIAVDPAGNSYVTGTTASSDFPAAGSSPPAYTGASDAFVTKVAAGSALVYSTHFPDTEEGRGIAVDAQGQVSFTGWTDPARGGIVSGIAFPDAFLKHLDASGQDMPEDQVTLGGWNDDYGYGIALDASGCFAYVTGQTYSDNFHPVPAPFGFPPEPVPSHGSAGDLIIHTTEYSSCYSVAPSPNPHVVTPTSVPRAVKPRPQDQAAPKADGDLVVWEDNGSGTWDIEAKNLATGASFPIYEGPADQRHPDISGNLVVWQDNRNGDWDIYGARIFSDTASAPFPIYVAPGDQISPAVNGNTVVWQSDPIALAPGSPDSLTHSDIAGTDVTADQVFTLTTGLNINTNPAIDHGIVVWQSTTSTVTLRPAAGGPSWNILGYDLTTSTPFTVSTGFADKRNPAISGNLVVWQEDVSDRLPGPNGAPHWNIMGGDIRRGNTFTVTESLNDQTLPDIQGRKVVYQEQSIINGQAPAGYPHWDIADLDLGSGNKQIVWDSDVASTGPAIAGAHVVWQQLLTSNNTNIYSNICATYSDVQPGDYYYDSIHALTCSNIFSGYTCGGLGEPCDADQDPYFRPFSSTTRGQLCKLIVLGNPSWTTTSPALSHFRDVLPGHPFYDYIETAYRHDIIDGYQDGTFHPDDNVTRAQLAKMVVLAEGWAIDTTGGPHFRDVLLGDPFYEFVETAFHKQIISGYTCGGDCLEFRPKNPATRSQVANIGYRTGWWFEVSFSP